MTISKVELSDKFHVWVSITNQILNEVNKNLVLESKQKLKTNKKDTLIDSINELYDRTVKIDSDTDIEQNISANVLSGKIKLQTGRDGGGNSYIEFYDDSKNVYRKLVYNHIEDEWYVENQQGELKRIINETSYIDGNTNTLTIKNLTNYENMNYKGRMGEFVYDTDYGELYIHDGITYGGQHVPIKTDIKVKISETDSQTGYLADKITQGTGIKISRNVNPTNDAETLVITNPLYNEFPQNHIPNSYLRRNDNNSLYEPVTIEHIKNEMNFDSIINELKDQVLNSLMYIGDIKSSTRTSNHGCWLLCNGQSISRTAFPELFSILGTSFGEGSLPNTFNLPDYRGKFLRGLGGDSASGMHITQKEGLPNITGNIVNMDHVGGGSANGAFTFTDHGGNGSGGSGGRHKNATVSLNASKSSAIYGASEHVTPINQAVNYFIKAF